ncbi:hypothetical protein [Agrobacterium sp.]|uniref:hypothetical protein n=1 Tax=Agrobacterium sp. TaxID=361 RepID=UPI0040344275
MGSTTVGRGGGSQPSICPCGLLLRPLLLPPLTLRPQCLLLPLPPLLPLLPLLLLPLLLLPLLLLPLLLLGVEGPDIEGVLGVASLLLPSPPPRLGIP